jgi:hypothetical protein
MAGARLAIAVLFWSTLALTAARAEPSIYATGVTPYDPAKALAELDWNGKVVWQWGANAPGGAAQQHHDWARLPNGNTLVLSVVVRRDLTVQPCPSELTARHPTEPIATGIANGGMGRYS